MALLAVVAACLAAFASRAVAAPPDPQTTNVPYLAWLGEQMRLTKRFPSTLEWLPHADWV